MTLLRSIGAAGGASIVDKTHAEMSALVAANGLIAGQKYRITDSQIANAIVEAISASTYRPYQDCNAMLNWNVNVDMALAGYSRFGNLNLSKMWSHVSRKGNLLCCIDQGPDNKYSSISTNGIDWTNHPLPAVIGAFGKIASNGAIFCVAGGETPSVLISTDGIDWVEYKTPGFFTSECGYSALFWSESLQLFIGGPDSNDYIASSPNGIDWTEHPIDTVLQFHTILQHGSSVFAVPYFTDRIYTSINGTNWGPQTISGSASLGYAASNQTVICAIGNEEGISGIYSSPDGINWTKKSDYSINRICSVGDVFFATLMDGSGLVMSKDDGESWTFIALPNAYWTAMTDYNAHLCAIAEENTLSVLLPIPSDIDYADTVTLLGVAGVSNTITRLENFNNNGHPVTFKAQPGYNFYLVGTKTPTEDGQFYWNGTVTLEGDNDGRIALERILVNGFYVLRERVPQQGKYTLDIVIDITGLTTLNIAANSAKSAVVINVDSANASETINLVQIAPTNYEFEIRPVEGLMLTIAGTAYSSLSADGQFLLESASITLDGNKKEFARFRKDAVSIYTIAKEVGRSVYV